MSEFLGFFSIEMLGAIGAGLFLLFLYWRDPYRSKAKQIMKKCERKPKTLFSVHHHHHHSH